MLYNPDMRDSGKVKKNDYSVIIGAVNIDICGKPYKPLIKFDSNPGVISSSVGGVGRKFPHNLRLLGVPVKLITALGDDQGAKSIITNCETLGIETGDSLHVSGASTSSYILITDEKGVMQLAVSDMVIYERITPDFLKTKISVINSAAVCVIDSNLSREAMVLWPITVQFRFLRIRSQQPRR